MARKGKNNRSIGNWLIDRIARGVIWVLLMLPYRVRVTAMGWLARRIIGPLSGFSRRSRANLAYIWPELEADERRQITREVLDNFGRVVIENYATDEQLSRASSWKVHGPGLDAAEAALAIQRPILFVSGHFGNYQAARAAMNIRGFNLGGLYRPLNNPFLNDHYVKTIEAAGGPAFARGRRGLAGFMRHIKDGGHGALLVDQYYRDGEILDFLGKPAPTAISVGEIALKYDALVVPIYARRMENGLDFDIVLEPPIPHSDPVAMTQALMDSLAQQIQERPGQWLWMHRRWKPERQAEMVAQKGHSQS